VEAPDQSLGKRALWVAISLCALSLDLVQAPDSRCGAADYRAEQLTL